MDTAFHRAGAEATETTPQTCAVCGYVMKEALGHTHSFTEKNDRRNGYLPKSP